MIDADGHVLEPMSAWDGLAESAAIHVTTDKYGLHHVFAGEQEIVTAPLGLLGSREAIAAFYRDTAFQFADLEPRPGPLVVDGNRVAVEIALRVNGTTAVADVFDVDGDGIRRLAVYLGRRLD